MQSSIPPQPPLPPVPVRRATDDDLPALVALERSAFAEPWSASSLEGELERPDSVILLVEAPGGKAAAYGAWRCLAAGAGLEGAGEAELLRLAVAPETRRRRLASALLAAGDEALWSAGCTACFLEVRADNHGAIAFYEARGFHRVGRRRGYYGGTCDALLYARPVRPPRRRRDRRPGRRTGGRAPREGG